MVVRLTQDGDKRRTEIAKIVLSIANFDPYDAPALANLAIAAMAEAVDGPHSKGVVPASASCATIG
jgi:hypothetical protein